MKSEKCYTLAQLYLDSYGNTVIEQDAEQPFRTGNIYVAALTVMSSFDYDRNPAKQFLIHLKTNTRPGVCEQGHQLHHSV